MKTSFILCASRIMILSGMAVAVCCAQEARAQESDAQESEGAGLYKSYCAQCHDGPVAGAPSLELLRQMTPERVVESLLYGTMRPQGKLLRRAQRLAVARFVAGKDFGAAEQQVQFCSDAPGEFREPFAAGSSSSGNWNGWAPAADNRRFQSTEAAGMEPSDVPNLKLKWAFALPFVTRM